MTFTFYEEDQLKIDIIDDKVGFIVLLCRQTPFADMAMVDGLGMTEDPHEACRIAARWLKQQVQAEPGWGATVPR